MILSCYWQGSSKTQTQNSSLNWISHTLTGKVFLPAGKKLRFPKESSPRECISSRLIICLRLWQVKANRKRRVKKFLKIKGLDAAELHGCKVPEIHSFWQPQLSRWLSSSVKLTRADKTRWGRVLVCISSLINISQYHFLTIRYISLPSVDAAGCSPSAGVEQKPRF